MALPHNEQAFKVEGRLPRRMEYPLWNVGVRGHRLWRERINVLLPHYEPLALDTPHEDDPDCFLVAENPMEIVDGEVVEWERTYCNVPEDWTDYILFNWEVPGIASTSAVGTEHAVSAARYYVQHYADAVATAAGRQSLRTHEFELASVSGISAGQVYRHRFTRMGSAIVGNRYWVQSLTRPAGATWWSPPEERSVEVTVLYVDSGTNTVYTTDANLGFTYPYYTASPISLGFSLAREPRGMAVTARVRYQYFHAEDPSRFYQPTPPWRIFSNVTRQIAGVTVAGAETDTITDVSTPNWTAYRNLIQQRSWLQVGWPSLTRYMGNIWQVATTEVQAV